MCGLRSRSRIQVEIPLGSLISLDWEISSVMIWGQVLPSVGAPNSSRCRGKGVRALGWNLGAPRCRHCVGTPDGGADSRHEGRDAVRMAADDGVGVALDKGSLS
jgi:hypothetical protein